ncbi:hypothetical protein R3W88_010696 [Solanum pinnatisectum]|uniref:Uncharacterized protein n=1 Tax=Solanum pinnatisectum TaxID=50273 RepID=A0AAV9L5B8_9SOLN|nr:hypothetical protein R3W88_010696 [Solanum pinnatisectum]
MSARFNLAVIEFGAPLKLWFSVSSVFFVVCVQFSPILSMGLRPKRNCSGAVFFEGFHIKQFLHLILLLRTPLT